jgi:hypothetical protein
MIYMLGLFIFEQVSRGIKTYVKTYLFIELSLLLKQLLLLFINSITGRSIRTHTYLSIVKSNKNPINYFYTSPYSIRVRGPISRSRYWFHDPDTSLDSLFRH